MKFGFCVPVFANPGSAFFRTPAATSLDPRAAVDAAVEAERCGFDSVWVADHLMHGFDDAIMEGWTTLSVIAGRTTRIGLGTIHLAQPFRAPAIAAKMSATLDAISGGRLIFFYDAGWQEAEVRAYGLDWPQEEERIRRMDEGLELIKTLWTSKQPVDFRGRFFETNGAVCRPGPAQRPGASDENLPRHWGPRRRQLEEVRPTATRAANGLVGRTSRPPIWLGEARSDAWLETIVKHADGWNSTPASPDRLRSKLDALRSACNQGWPRHGGAGVVARNSSADRAD